MIQQRAPKWRMTATDQERLHAADRVALDEAMSAIAQDLPPQEEGAAAPQTEDGLVYEVLVFQSAVSPQRAIEGWISLLKRAVVGGKRLIWRINPEFAEFRGQWKIYGRFAVDRAGVQENAAS